MFQPVTIGNYKLTQFIGSGSFATAWLGEHKVTGNKVAVKVICKTSMNSVQSFARFRREIGLLKLIEHPFIVQLFDIIEDDEAFYLVMEYVENGSLFTRINKEGFLNEDIARRYFCQLLSALNYLHNEKMIAHRDLKPENILIDKYNNIRLIDFGLSNQFSKSSPILNTSCGSPAYAAPEMIQGKPYTKSVDIWSAGIILYAMVAGRLPFDDSNDQVLLQKIVYTDQVFPPNMSRSLIDLLKRLLSKDPKNRLSITQISNHPWLSNSQYVSIIDNRFYFSYMNIPFISSSALMPVLSISSPSSLKYSNISNSEPIIEIQNSSSYDNLSINSNSSFDSDNLSQHDHFQDISQSQNAIQLPNHLIDQVVVNHMISIGIDISYLAEYLIHNKFNDITAIYKQIKKAKTSYTVANIIDVLNKSAMFSKLQAPIMNSFQVQNPKTIRRSSYPTQQSNQKDLYLFHPKNANMKIELMNPKVIPNEKNLQLSMIIQA